MKRGWRSEVTQPPVTLSHSPEPFHFRILELFHRTSLLLSILDVLALSLREPDLICSALLGAKGKCGLARHCWLPGSDGRFGCACSCYLPVHQIWLLEELLAG